MTKQLVIDSIQFSRQLSDLNGKIELSSLPRLRGELIEGASGVIDFHLTGANGDHGEALLHLEISGGLEMACQRCLKSLEFIVDLNVTYELRDDLDDNELLQEDLENDSRDFISASQSLDLVVLIEDEVLLALPAVPRHDSCDPPEIEHDPEAASPFGMLLHLKKQSGKTH